MNALIFLNETTLFWTNKSLELTHPSLTRVWLSWPDLAELVGFDPYLIQWNYHIQKKKKMPCQAYIHNKFF